MDEIPSSLRFSADYRRYTPEAAGLLMRISEALGTVRAARVLPAVADELRASARVGTVHYSNLIEGNQLPMIAAEQAARGALAPDTKAKIELVNYVNALDLIDQRVDDGTLELTPGFLKELHGVTTKGLGREDDPHFKPHHEGEWRDGTAVVVDQLTHQILHEGPPAEEVEPRMRSMFEWMRGKLGTELPFIVAGVMHYGITDVHPFADGNGRAARLFQAVLLTQAQALPGRMFSFERYYAEDRTAYYDALRSVRRNTFNMEFWLEYFLSGLAEEYERVASTVVDLGQLAAGAEQAPLRLSASQQNGLTKLRLDGRREFTRRDYEPAAGVARSAAGKELQGLVRHGVLTVRGRGATTTYAFAGPAGSAATTTRAGRKVIWTEHAIEHELRAWLDGRSSWPTYQEFIAAGKRDLYAAASRNGGTARWRRIMGL
ncbi:MAG TPA: Fic family protein [Solirubrobacteraceae bacterium]|nr:Fic family protein [Solirubrobacteraceae bacterium]